MVAATLEKNLGPPMPKRSNDSYHQENQELQTTRTLSITCQINAVNKQLVPPLNSETLMTYLLFPRQNILPCQK